MHSRSWQHLHTNSILVTEENSFWKGISNENVAIRLTAYWPKKCILEELSVIWQTLLIV